MTRVEAPIDIDAPAERIWGILIDFPAYGEWNPFLREVVGRLQLGARVSVRIETPGRGSRTLRLVVSTIEPDHELAWATRLGVPGLFDADHRLCIERRDGDASRFVQSAEFRGMLLPMLRGLDKSVAAGIEQMNGALKSRAEAGLN